MKQDQQLSEERAPGPLDYRLLFDMADDAIFVWEKEPGTEKVQLVDVNQAACARYGFTHEEFLGLDGTKLNTLDSFIAYKKRASELQRTGHCIIELTHVAKNGQLINIESNAHQFISGGRTFVVSVCRDLAARKQTQQEALESLVKTLVHDRLSDTLDKLETAALSRRADFTDFVFSASLRKVSHRGRTVDLTSSESVILRLLLRERGKVLGFPAFAKALGKAPTPVFVKRLRVHIHNLRQKLESDPATPRIVLSRPGKGYLLSESTEA
ncbi:winged helix-turn-helix domain-containing protein [Dehalogenimonas sp. 4OHTPN]|uniref:Winged helix-turn-helix domain-containing protein n=1 Tax=Dehalogenimonas sp. 4OHTPN TaxID=3166643 RepID=A0AAU8G8S9_9CHLR